jgi:RHS repeat-associated protein
VASLRYWPFGSIRTVTYANGYTALPTDRLFTGQIRDLGSDSYYFFTRHHYDAVIGKFHVPDTIVPNPGNPQALNRYSYAINHVSKLTDPTGHDYTDGSDDPTYDPPPEETPIDGSSSGNDGANGGNDGSTSGADESTDSGGVSSGSNASTSGGAGGQGAGDGSFYTNPCPTAPVEMPPRSTASPISGPPGLAAAPPTDTPTAQSTPLPRPRPRILAGAARQMSSRASRS